MDINTQIYRLEAEDKLTLAIAKSLALDDKPDQGVYDQTTKSSLLDDYSYCMYGKVFRYEVVDGKVTACVSFGGLLMSIVGDHRHISLELDSHIYLLLRKLRE